ncbi:hypothetical protein AGLY_009184 [Aphis glycines]|uniref:Uncharacterized protein n=1 Tax=Aphis glycines TaxID=307491 RepID=A0A6G0TIK4_APHGL|nr:hypothetical protein AGLY_009184 [Aphis glycines]
MLGVHLRETLAARIVPGAELAARVPEQHQEMSGLGSVDFLKYSLFGFPVHYARKYAIFHRVQYYTTVGLGHWLFLTIQIHERTGFTRCTIVVSKICFTLCSVQRRICKNVRQTCYQNFREEVDVRRVSAKQSCDPRVQHKNEIKIKQKKISNNIKRENIVSIVTKTRFVIEPFLPRDGVMVPSGVSLRSTCIVFGRGRPLCILLRNLGGPPILLTSLSASSIVFLILYCSNITALLCFSSSFLRNFISSFSFSFSFLFCASISFLFLISSCCCLRCNDNKRILSFFFSISSMATLI